MQHVRPPIQLVALIAAALLLLAAGFVVSSVATRGAHPVEPVMPHVE